MRLKALMATLTTMALTVPALAAEDGGDWSKGGDWHKVPEIGSTGSLAAIIAVAALAMILWERRRRAQTHMD